MSAADVMIATGALLVAGAVAVLTSAAWAVLWLGTVLMGAGAVRARSEAGHVDVTTVLVALLVVIVVLVLVGRL